LEPVVLPSKAHVILSFALSVELRYSTNSTATFRNILSELGKFSMTNYAPKSNMEEQKVVAR
jgi:hypothetical protein